MNAILTNAVALNGGDAAIMIAIMRGLDEYAPSPLNWVVSDSQPAVAQRYYPEIAFGPLASSSIADLVGRVFRGPLRRFRQPVADRMASGFLGAVGRSSALQSLPLQVMDVMRIYAAADFVVSTGGTYLVEHYDLRPRFREFDLIRRIGLPLVLYTQSLGPFSNRVNREKVAEVFGYARLILLRDERSRAAVIDLGIDPQKCHVLPDSVFGLYHTPVRPALRKAERRSPRVAISVRSWTHFKTCGKEEGMQRYKDAVAGVISHLVLQHNAEVTLVSTCQGIPEYWMDDSVTAVGVHEQLPPEIAARVEVNRDFHDPLKLIDKLRGFDLVVATRMHFAIMALIAEVPTVAIAYEFKTTELFAALGLDHQLEDIETVTSRSLCTLVDRTLAAKETEVARLRTLLPGWSSRAREAAKLTWEAVAPPAPPPSLRRDAEHNL